MRIPYGKFTHERRDATVPTTVVVVTQVVTPATRTPTISTPSPTIQPTVTVLMTITPGATTNNANLGYTTVTSVPNVLTVQSTTLANGASNNLLTASTTVPTSSNILSDSASSASLALKPTPTSSASNTAISQMLGSGSSSSTRLGLAIGIPIAAVSIFGLVVFILIILRKRMDPKPTETLAFKAKKAKEASAKTLAEKHSVSSVYSSSDIEQAYEQNYDPRLGHNANGAALPHGQKQNFLKRISRLMNVPDSPLEFKSPLFLRRFNLSSNKYEGEAGEKQEKALPKSPLSAKPYAETPAPPKTEFPAREISSKPEAPEKSTYVVVKPYARRLGDELTVCIGEKVTIVDQHSDGWANVQMTESGDVGVIPLMCIKKFLGK
ncbi:hypothetical protein JCM33374_g5342 [Metschnikowia sp. JCM 33374]|nr:hypothetical protein JCM33374_g5342 [Metschnikowia sp. JCM 33374]